MPPAEFKDYPDFLRGQLPYNVGYYVALGLLILWPGHMPIWLVCLLGASGLRQSRLFDYLQSKSSPSKLPALQRDIQLLGRGIIAGIMAALTLCLFLFHPTSGFVFLLFFMFSFYSLYADMAVHFRQIRRLQNK